MSIRLVQWVVGSACSVKVSSHCDQVSPPLHTPLGNVAQPQPWPQGRAQASDAFESGFLLNMATAASLFTSGFWLYMVRCVVSAADVELRWCRDLRCFTSELVAARTGMTHNVKRFRLTKASDTHVGSARADVAARSSDAACLPPAQSAAAAAASL